MSLTRIFGKKPIIPKPPVLRVGWFETAKYESGAPVAAVAAAQEFGSGPIPPRPFMRPTIERDKEEWRKLSERSARAIVEGAMDEAQALDLLGAKVAGGIKKSIKAVTDPPLSEATLAARAAKASRGEASDKPLVDSGLMIGSVTWSTEK